MWGSIQVLLNQISEQSFYTFEDIDLRDSLRKPKVFALQILQRYLTK